MKDKLLIILLPILLFFSCAYFNTFYNAEQYYKDALNELEKEKNNATTRSVMDKFDTAIGKANKVLLEYPDSKWADDALYIIALSLYYKGDYGFAKEKFEEFIKKYPSSEFLTEIEIWYGKNLWALGEKELALQQWKQISKSTNDRGLLAEIYLAMAEAFYEQNSLDSSLYYYKEITNLNRVDRNIQAEAQYRVAELYLEKGKIQDAIDALQKIRRYSPNPEIRGRMQVMLAQIYRESGRYEEARELIMSKLNDPDNEEIRGALELEFGLLYLAEGDYESARSRLSQVTEMYKKTPESAEAYYHLAMLNMTHFHSYEEAQKQFQMVISEDPNSKFAQIAKQKVQELKRFFAVKKEFDSVEPKVKEIIAHFSLSEDSVANEPNSDRTPGKLEEEVGQQLVQTESSIDTLELFSNYYQKIYEMAEFYYFNFNLVDTAISYFEKIIHSPWYNPYIEKSLYALYFIYSNEKDTVDANFHKEVLKKYNPESPYLSFIENRGKVLSEAERELKHKYSKAESFLSTNPDSAISIFEGITKEHPESLYGEKSVLSLAWIYRHKFYNIDSTLLWYDYFLEHYPDSKYYTEIQKEYDAISSLLSSSPTSPTLQGEGEIDSDSLEIARQNSLPESEQQGPDTSKVKDSDVPLK